MKKQFCSRIAKLHSISSCNNFKGEMWKEVKQRKHVLGLLVMLEFPDFLLVYQVSAGKLPCHQDSVLLIHITSLVLFCSCIYCKG